MAANPASDTPRYTLNRDALLYAWAQLSVYDQTASRLKTNFVRRRNVVIALILTSTIASVVAGIIEVPALLLILAILSIGLPIISSYVMADIVRFTGTSSWIKYRYVAELMRMHIYLFRMRAGDYARVPVEKMDNLLAQNLSAVREYLKGDDLIPIEMAPPQTEDEIIAAIRQANSTSPDDDGLSAPSIDQYLRWRLDSQRSWYDGKVKNDYAQLKRSTRLGQTVLLVGALLSALGGVANVQFITLIAIANAASIALTTWSSVSMFGKTYGLFQIASQQLGDLKLDWHAQQDDSEMQDPVTREEAIANLVQRVENTLQWERTEWYEVALQEQSNADRMILGDLKQLSDRARVARDDNTTLVIAAAADTPSAVTTPRLPTGADEQSHIPEQAQQHDEENSDGRSRQSLSGG